MRALPRIRGVLLAAFACAASVALTAGGPQQPTGQGAPTFRSSVNLVQVSVIVTDASGTPVAGLTQDDFEVYENKGLRPITSFVPVDIPLQSDERAPAERDVLGNDGPQGRLYVIALDRMAPDTALRARSILREFIEKHFGPDDTAAVVLTTGGPSDSGQEFTGNTRLLLTAIDRFDGGTDAGGSRENSFLGDFRNLVEFMTTLRGARKALILVTSSLPADPYDLVSGRRLGGMFSQVHPDLVDAVSFATRNNIAIYPIDPIGLTTELSAPGSFDTSELDRRSGLHGLAEITGGFALTNSNGYEAAFNRLVRENSTYYVLGFDSADDRRAAYSSVEVRVKRPGLTVQNMNGFITSRRPVKQVKRAPGVLAAAWDSVASAITTSGVPMRVYAAPFKGPGKDALVEITLEIAADRLTFEEAGGVHRGEMDVVFAVTNARGGKRYPIIRHRATLALSPATHASIRHSALRVLSQIRLPKGRYQLRVSAGGAAIAGGVIYDLEVPDFQDDLALSGLALMSSNTRRTYTVSPHARIDVNFPGPPTTVREFAGDDRVTLYTEVYENRRKPHTVTLTAELRDASGKVVGADETERQVREKPNDTSVHVFSPTLALDGLEPGQYVIRVEARSSLDRNKRLTREIPIRVRP